MFAFTNLIKSMEFIMPAITRFSGLSENDGHEIGGQDIYRLKIDYIIMQCAILFKTTAEYKSQQ